MEGKKKVEQQYLLNNKIQTRNIEIARIRRKTKGQEVNSTKLKPQIELETAEFTLKNEKIQKKNKR